MMWLNLKIFNIYDTMQLWWFKCNMLWRYMQICLAGEEITLSKFRVRKTTRMTLVRLCASDGRFPIPRGHGRGFVNDSTSTNTHIRSLGHLRTLQETIV